MTEPKFSEIEPLIVSRRVDAKNDTVHCVFACPVTLRQVVASAGIRQGDGFSDRLVDSASHSFWYQLRRQVADKVCSFLPNGFVREVAEGTAWRMLYSSGDDVNTSQEIDEATLQAFTSVQNEFVREGDRLIGREVGDDFANEFQRQLRRTPITTRYEAATLGKTLAAMANLGGLDSAEQEFLAEFGKDAGGADKAPSAVELSEVQQEFKPTLYMLASAIALVDQERSPEERAYLDQVQRGLGLSADEARSLRQAAGQFVVEQAVGLGAQPGEEELARLAHLGEISVEDVERVLVRRQKRKA